MSSDRQPGDPRSLFAEYFRRVSTIRLFASGPAAPFVFRFATELRAQGYSRMVVRQYVSVVDHLGRWCARSGRLITDVDEQVLDSFQRHARNCACVPFGRHGRHYVVRYAVRRFLRHLRTTGLSIAPAPKRAPAPELVRDYCSWTKREKGLADVTLAAHARYVTAFIHVAGDDPRRYTAAVVRRFFLDQARQASQARTQKVIDAVRGFFRYLVALGRCSDCLLGVVPRIARWRLAELPRYLPAGAVDRLINACDPNTKAGALDRAMVLLMVRLGLRAGEVASLRFGDIEWAAGHVRVMGKSRREARLPLPQEVGDAIVAYLRHARPRSSDDHVFLREQAPIGPYLRGPALSYRVRQTMQRAGIDTPARGAAHVLRHSFATGLLRHGMPLEGIGALLRHGSIETTAVYAKVDIDVLRDVAQPWPTKEGPHATP